MLKVILCIILSLPILVHSLRSVQMDIDPDLNIVHFFLYYGLAQTFIFIVTLSLALFSTLFWFVAIFTGIKVLHVILT
jgi:hypothetical protein